MKSKKIVVNYSNIDEYTGNKIDLEIDKINKSIANLEDFIFNYEDKLDKKKENLGEQKVILLKLKNLKRLNNLKCY